MQNSAASPASLKHDTTPLRGISISVKKTFDPLKAENISSSEPSHSLSTSVDAAVKSAAAKYSIPEKMIEAVICAESGGKCNAVSKAGAKGLMQLMPATAAELGVKDPFNAKQNVDGGTKYLRKLHDRYDGNWEKVLAAYNAGMSRVDKYNGIPPFKETIAYVKKVLSRFFS